MDLTMEYKGKTFNFDLFTDKHGNRQLWMDRKAFSKWEKATKNLPSWEKAEEERSFYMSLQEHLEDLGRYYQLWTEKWAIPEPNSGIPNWYIDDDDNIDE